ncbi:piggyBac transposable element-derived protein 4-like [Watersipora subatra]|uniref:piggyBac transposable element-derived protein 4-like n=1 Tax=Watersipora subatra TaxID=2589382 RepID=UPI00355C75DC
MDFWHLLVEQTNHYAQTYLTQNPNLPPYSRARAWTDTDEVEMKAFLGLLLNMGLNQKPTIAAYWDETNSSQETPYFRNVMTVNRFKLLLQFFHVSDNALILPRDDPNHDPLHKFRPVLEMFNNNFASNYNLARDVSIDESLAGFKGRHMMVNYIKIKKHHQWGPKMYILAESSTGYVHRSVFHLPKKYQPPQSQKGQPYDVCMKLMDGHFNKGHRLGVDNYYTSIDLCSDLHQKGTYCTGTVRSNRRGLPPAVKDNKMLRKGEHVSLRKGAILAVNFHDRKCVKFLSTLATAKTEIAQRRIGNEFQRLSVVGLYNSTMGGVDLSDQLTCEYADGRRTVKMWKKIVFHLIDKAAVNSCICFQKNGKKVVSRYSFMIRLVEEPIGGYRSGGRKRGRPSTGANDTRLIGKHFIRFIPDRKRKKCMVCGDGEGYSGTRIQTYCPTCDVGLCIGECDERYHTYVNYKL